MGLDHAITEWNSRGENDSKIWAVLNSMEGLSEARADSHSHPRCWWACRCWRAHVTPVDVRWGLLPKSLEGWVFGMPNGKAKRSRHSDMLMAGTANNPPPPPDPCSPQPPHFSTMVTPPPVNIFLSLFFKNLKLATKLKEKIHPDLFIYFIFIYFILFPSSLSLLCELCIKAGKNKSAVQGRTKTRMDGMWSHLFWRTPKSCVWLHT